MKLGHQRKDHKQGMDGLVRFLVLADPVGAFPAIVKSLRAFV